MRLTPFLAIFAIATPVAAVPLPTSATAPAPLAKPIATSAAAKRIQADVDFLADDLLEGRETGQRGFDLAARYVRSRMFNLGLAPGALGTFEQRVPFLARSVRRDGQTYVAIGGTKLVHSGTVLVSASSEPLTTAPAVFAGYGLTDNRLGIDDYAGLDVRGKIVVALAGFPTGLPSDVAAHLNNNKASNAAAHGAIGLVVVDTPTRERVYPFKSRVEHAFDRAMVWVEPDGRPHTNAPGIRAIASVGLGGAPELFAGSGHDWASILAEIADLKSRPRGFALARPIIIAASVESSSAASANIIGLIPGSDPRLSKEVVLMTAHLDHLGLADKGPDRVFNGALDNALGVAVLLEAARGLMSGPRPRRTVAIVALTGEEKGLQGSDYLAHFPAFGSRHIVADVNIDMPVLLGRFTGVLAFGAEHSSIGEAVARAARQTGLALMPDQTPEEAYFVRSDQYSFVKAGIPAVKLNPQFDSAGAARETRFRKTDYHHVSDSADLPIWWDEAARFARLNLAIARDLADRPASPAWKAQSYFRPVPPPSRP